MKIEAVQINNFRSISSCELTSCGGLNVLIGKNNSGKSNVLSAIHAFFLAIDGANLICLEPPVTREVDFYKKNFDSPAEVTLTFSLSQEDRDAVVAGLREDSPQMSNAISSLDAEMFLRVRVCFTIKPMPYAYVKRISFVSPNDTQEQMELNEHILLDVNLDAALEIHEKYRRYQQDETHINELREALSEVDRNDWARLRRDLAEGITGYRGVRTPGRRPTANPAAFQTIESAVRDSSAYEEFRSTVQAEINSLSRYLANSDKHDLDQESVDTFSGKASSIPSHILKLLQNLSAIKILNITDNRRPIGRDEAQVLLNLKMQRGGEESLRHIQEIVFTLLGVRIDAFSGNQTARVGMPSAELDVDDFVVEVNGAGIKEALRLLLDLEFQKPNLLLVEEPEIHLHPGMESTIMRHLKEVSQQHQMFITTHSTNFLDAAEKRNIYLVSKADSTTTQLLNQGEIEEHIPAELGIRFSSLFVYDRLVFVESQTDEDIIRTLASTCGVNYDQTNVGFIHMEGSRNLSYFAAKSTLSFLARRQVRMWFMIDRDEKDEEDIQSIREQLGDNAVASVLQKREIENYLIHPTILVEQILAKRADGGNQGTVSVTAEDVQALMEQSAESLKSVAIFKRVAKTICRPLYPQTQDLQDAGGRPAKEMALEQIRTWEERLAELKESIDEEANKQTVAVESHWLENKFNIIPGDELINMVYRHYGVRFNKERGDGVALARMMTKEEVGSELETLIRSIGT